jgi:hypothetical protein
MQDINQGAFRKESHAHRARQRPLAPFGGVFFR